MNQTVQDKDWPRLKIKHAIERAGLSQRDIARRSGKHFTSVNRVIGDGLHSSPIERVIADTLGVRPQQIWPSRYNKNGSTQN